MPSAAARRQSRLLREPKGPSRCRTPRAGALVLTTPAQAADWAGKLRSLKPSGRPIHPLLDPWKRRASTRRHLLPNERGRRTETKQMSRARVVRDSSRLQWSVCPEAPQAACAVITGRAIDRAVDGKQRSGAKPFRHREIPSPSQAQINSRDRKRKRHFLSDRRPSLHLVFDRPTHLVRLMKRKIGPQEISPR